MQGCLIGYTRNKQKVLSPPVELACGVTRLTAASTKGGCLLLVAYHPRKVIEPTTARSTQLQEAVLQKAAAR